MCYSSPKIQISTTKQGRSLGFFLGASDRNAIPIAIAIAIAIARRVIDFFPPPSHGHKTLPRFTAALQLKKKKLAAPLSVHRPPAGPAQQHSTRLCCCKLYSVRTYGAGSNK